MAHPHTFELVADRAAQWVDTMGTTLANMVRENDRAPFAANLSEKEKLAQYEQQLFHPDGSENSVGSKQLLDTFGVEPHGIAQYARIKAAVLKARAERVAMQAMPPMEE